VLTRFALVCKTWRAVSLETELWRRLIARRWAALHSHDAVDVDGLLGPATACYTMQDVYMRLVATPSHLVCTSAKLALSAPPGGDANAPTVATFTGNVLGGNQTARADAPWSCSVGGGMHAGSGFHSPPVGTLRACSEREQLPPGARALQSRAGARASVQLCAELQLVHYFEATILPALEAPPGPNDRPLPFTHQRSCVAIGMCSQRFPLAGAWARSDPRATRSRGAPAAADRARSPRARSTRASSFAIAQAGCPAGTATRLPTTGTMDAAS
jgi:hypothetical protein